MLREIWGTVCLYADASGFIIPCPNIRPLHSPANPPVNLSILPADELR